MYQIIFSPYLNLVTSCTIKDGFITCRTQHEFSHFRVEVNFHHILVKLQNCNNDVVRNVKWNGGYNYGIFKTWDSLIKYGQQ